MSAGPLCASPGCDNPVVRRHGQPGRPPIYCSPTCRPSCASRTVQGCITIEVDDGADDDSGPHSGRTWVLRVRRGKRTVTFAQALGRFSASVLSGELRRLLHPGTRQDGDAID